MRGTERRSISPVFGDSRFADGSATEGGNDGALTDGATLLRSSTGPGGPLACNHQPVTIPATKQANMAAIGNERRAMFFFTASHSDHRNVTGVPGLTSATRRAASQLVNRTQP